MAFSTYIMPHRKSSVNEHKHRRLRARIHNRPVESICIQSFFSHFLSNIFEWNHKYFNILLLCVGIGTVHNTNIQKKSAKKKNTKYYGPKTFFFNVRRKITTKYRLIKTEEERKTILSINRANCTLIHLIEMFTIHTFGQTKKLYYQQKRQLSVRVWFWAKLSISKITSDWGTCA